MQSMQPDAIYLWDSPNAHNLPAGLGEIRGRTHKEGKIHGDQLIVTGVTRIAPDGGPILREASNGGMLAAAAYQIWLFKTPLAGVRENIRSTRRNQAALTSPRSKPRPGLTDPAAVGKLCRAIDGYTGKGPLVRSALRLLSLTLVRPGERAKAEWSEINFGTRIWTIPAAKMKMRRDHQVPLSRQVLAVLAAVKAINGNRRYVFATYEDKPLSGNTFNTALRIMGYDTQNEHCAHGFRTTASTLLNEQRGADGKPVWHPDVIELQLAHVDANGTRAIYNRAQYWPDRVRLMQLWADRLDNLRDGGQVVTLSRQAAG